MADAGGVGAEEASIDSPLGGGSDDGGDARGASGSGDRDGGSGGSDGGSDSDVPSGGSGGAARDSGSDTVTLSDDPTPPAHDPREERVVAAGAAEAGRPAALGDAAVAAGGSVASTTTTLPRSNALTASVPKDLTTTTPGATPSGASRLGTSWPSSTLGNGMVPPALASQVALAGDKRPDNGSKSEGNEKDKKKGLLARARDKAAARLRRDK